jgi:hypothetical protein
VIALRSGVLVLDVNANTAAKVKRGQKVTATCTGAGTDAAAPIINDCFIN